MSDEEDNDSDFDPDNATYKMALGKKQSTDSDSDDS